MPSECLRLRVITAADQAASGYESLLAQVLAVQRMRAWRPTVPGVERAEAFLATTWASSELRQLLEEGAWMVVAVDTESDRVLGYSVIAPIRHLPPGDFVPEADSPLRTRAELADERRFMYGYQIAVRPDATARQPSIGAAVFAASIREASRRNINVVSCAMEKPVRNARGLAFLSAMGRRRVGVLLDPEGPPLMRGPVQWACLVTWPLRPGRCHAG